MLAAQFKMARRLHSLRNGNVETHQPIIHPAFSYMNLRHCRSSPYHHQASLKSKRSIGILARAASVGDDGTSPLRAVEGDIVTLHWTCCNENGEMLESSNPPNEPATFEVGAGNIVGNRIFEAFDEAVRGLAVGETVSIKAQGGPWQQELLFNVPREHEEIQRLEGRYKSSGGISEGQLVELSNGGMALVVKCTDSLVVLDANSMMAGKTLVFQIELIDLERPHHS